ncbi:acyl--CoA ligase [Pelagibius litoralis]|uniref:Acyl--CoA ligase n=1 Tax=Pelagibius litoralis TaxID=374515 RepID=A0A967C259_9PROT|nr:class I adenylate-forming enzyme family protein [Pelagibius litoralis]NIA67883.1 acyl--CoA ligase [Pelagibius litoralis]
MGIGSFEAGDPRANNLGYWSHLAALDGPERIAMIDLSGAAERQVPYAELEARLDRFAALITGLGLQPGDRLAMSIGNRFEFVEIMYGAMRVGIVPVPLNTKLGADTLDYTIRDAGCRGAVIDPAVNSVIVAVVDSAALPVRLALDSPPEGWGAYEPALMSTPAEFAPPVIADDHPSFQPYTSGSTGRPKGVVLTHAGQLWWIDCLKKYWPYDPDARVLAAVPLYHKNAMAGAIKPKLNVGATVVILPDFEPRRFLQTLADYRITKTGAVPSVFSVLLQHRDLIESLDFSALQSLSIGSAPVSEELMEQIQSAFGVDVSESYGLTEGGPVMIGPPLDGRAVPFGSCGVAWPEGEVKLVDSNGVTQGGFGELWVRNPGVTPGYHNLPAVNAERIVDGWLKTGDVFACDGDGFYYFRGRTDDMFKSSGESIYPKEVENLLLSHTAVVDACVVPIRHSFKGHVPAAMVMLARAEAADEAALKQYCLDNGPAYAHPRHVVIVEQIPLNGAGKNDRTVVERDLDERFGAKETA